MGRYLDSIPFSGIMRIRDMMFGIDNPYRLDQGDVGFDAPDAVKEAMRRAIDENKTHYVQTIGIPRLRELLVDKLSRQNEIPVEGVPSIHLPHAPRNAKHFRDGVLGPLTLIYAVRKSPCQSGRTSPPPRRS